MKVLQVINSLHTGGAEKLILDSVPLYQKKGIEMDVLTLKKDKTSFWTSLKSHTSGQLNGLTTGSVYNPFLIIKVIPYLKKYDLLHAHLFPTLYWVVIARWISGASIPIIYTEHSTNNKRRKHFLLKRIDQWIYMKIDKIVSISEVVDQKIKKHLPTIKSANFDLIFNGIDLGNFKNVNKINNTVKNDQIILIQVSSFRTQKDQPTLIKAMPLLPSYVRLILVGDGPLKIECEKLVSALNVKNRVEFLGLQMNIPEIIKQTDIVILSSFYEGFGLAIVEGMAAMKPCIASDVPGLREIVNGYGLLFERGNSQQLAVIILNLIEDSFYYNKVAKQCYIRAQEFDIDKMVNRYINLYNNCLQSANNFQKINPM